MSVHTTKQEAVMGKAIPTHHPAVVLRSHYRNVRALLAVAMAAVVALSGAVVILATDGDEVASTNSATPIEPIQYGGFNPATGRPESAPMPPSAHPLVSPYHGGPEEGTSGALSSGAPVDAAPGIRYDGGPEEGSSGALSSGASASATPGIRYDGGPEEGTTGAGR
jgi:hypothetical protein